MAKVFIAKKQTQQYKLCKNCGSRIPESRGAKSKFCSTTCCQLYHGAISGGWSTSHSRPIY